jgi:histone-arginine methyltransferase CARM1
MIFLSTGNMLADYVRTGTYQKAIYNNSTDFAGKVVLDVGTGTGILAFFALQAGAARVYAVDASNAVIVAKKLAEANGFGDRMIVIKGKIEEINLPEQVDVIISEPIGFLLVHERMLESYVVARDRFLKPEGLMMPTTGSIVLCPISDEACHKEQLDRVAFWEARDFYGVDLSAVVEQAYLEYFSQPIVGESSATIFRLHVCLCCVLCECAANALVYVDDGVIFAQKMASFRHSKHQTCLLSFLL